MFVAVRTGLEPATPCVTGMYSNQAELPHQNFSFLTGEECSRSSFELLATVGLSPCLRVQSYNVFFYSAKFLGKKCSPADTAISFKKAKKLQERCYLLANTSMIVMVFISPFSTMSDGIYDW